MNTGETKQEKQEVEWLVQFPDKEKVTRFVRPSLEAACYGNERIASILNYFLYEAVKEAKNQRLEKGCKVVAFERKHKDITDRLKFPLSRKTLIRYLDLLNEWGYVTSERYQKTFTVNHDTIQEAINNPPAKPVKYQWLQEKSCKVVDIQPSESCTDTTLTDPKKVVELQQKVECLQEKVEYLQQKVDIFTTLQPYLEAWIQAAGVPVPESLRNINNNLNLSSSNIVVSANASTTPIEDKAQENSYSQEPQQATLLEVEGTEKDKQPGKSKTEQPPKEKKVELTAEQMEQCRRWYAHFEKVHGEPFEGKGEIVNVRKYIKMLVVKYDETTIMRIYKHLSEKDFKWSKPSFKFKITPYVVYDNAPSVLQQLGIIQEAPKLDAKPTDLDEERQKREREEEKNRRNLEAAKQASIARMQEKLARGAKLHNFEVVMAVESYGLTLPSQYMAQYDAAKQVAISQ